VTSVWKISKFATSWVCNQLIVFDNFPLFIANILLLDNGAFHKAKALALADNLITIFLPPYSPELNPIERLWRDLKDQLAGNLSPILDELFEQVAQIITRYLYNPKPIGWAMRIPKALFAPLLALLAISAGCATGTHVLTLPLTSGVLHVDGIYIGSHSITM
jgi:hypothetical protein